jgi:hypothetical protein
VQKITTGPDEQRGIWVHPQVAINLAMWCSVGFAVQVTAWAKEEDRPSCRPLARQNPNKPGISIIFEVV